MNPERYRCFTPIRDPRGAVERVIGADGKLPLSTCSAPLLPGHRELSRQAAAGLAKLKPSPRTFHP